MNRRHRDASCRRPRIAVTLGDPRGIGAEITAAAVTSPRVRESAEFRIVGPTGIATIPANTFDSQPGLRFEAIGEWTGEPEDNATAGGLAAAAIEHACSLAMEGDVDGIVTAPISKQALRAAGYPYPGHTEFLRELSGVPDVTMIMAAESTPLGGALRLALLTVHVPLRDVPGLLSVELIVRRSSLAVSALREWWGIPDPRIAMAGLNPHASEGGLFGDEEARILAPALSRIESETGAEVTGIFPADTVFRRCLEGHVELVIVPYHDVGLAVLKTLARDQGVNVTAGLPFPRTAPDHGTAFDIAGRGLADPGAMVAAIDLCATFCRRRIQADT